MVHRCTPPQAPPSDIAPKHSGDTRSAAVGERMRFLPSADLGSGAGANAMMFYRLR